MNDAPVFAAWRSPAPVARYDKAMRLHLLRSLLSPIVSARWAQFIGRYDRRFEAGPARAPLKPAQGPSVGHNREAIDATRERRGLRPKDATLLAARAFAKAVGATSVHAIANSHRVLARLNGAAKHADYDAYWRERGAAPGGPLGFVFPPLEEIEPAGNLRAAAKATIVAATHRFVTAHARAGGARAP